MGAHIISSREDAAAVLVSVRRLVRFLRLAERESESVHGVSAAQLFVLRSLAEAPSQSLGELAERTLTDQSSVSTVVLKLENRGLLVRRRAKTDGRRLELELSARGKALVARAHDLAQTRIVDAVTAMPAAKRRMLVGSLDALVHGIGADALAPKMLFDDENGTPRASKESKTPRRKKR